MHHSAHTIPTALQEGRYTWRHDSVLLDIKQSLQSQFGTDNHIYTDLPGLRVPPAIIPSEVVTTTSRPDIVLMNRRQLHMLELTVCSSSCDAMEAAHARKSSKPDYLHVLADARRRGWEATIEIGILGHHHPAAPAELANNCPDIPLRKWRDILVRAGTTAINCSQAIFLVRA